MAKNVSDEHGFKGVETISSSSSCQSSSSPRSSPYVHEVGVPPKQNLLKEIAAAVKETLFADDPLRHFKDQPSSKKFILGLQAIFPILEWGKHYNLSKFKGDLIGGLTIASLCIPQKNFSFIQLFFIQNRTLDMQSLPIWNPNMDYVGFLQVTKLGTNQLIIQLLIKELDFNSMTDSSFVPPLVYAFMGSSRDIAIGPVAVVSLLLGSLLQDEIDSSANPVGYRHLAFTATFFAGLTQFILGFFRLGFLMDFLSHAAIVGFMGGAAVTIALQQLKGLLGIKNFTKDTDIVSVMSSVFSSARHGVKNIRKGINPPSVKEIIFSGQYAGKGFKIGVVSGMIALTEAVAIGRTFASMKDYQLDGNKEMIALGTMNIVGSMTSCYVATGSFSRSAVNYMSGCETAVSNIVMACVVLLTLALITPLFKYTPNAILASIIISAVVGLVDIEAVTLIWKIDKFDFIACMGAFFGVVFSSVEVGLVIAVSISFAKILLQVTRPRTAILGKVPRTATVYRNIQQYPDATKVSGILIVRVDSAIYFSNSNYVKERILRWLADEEHVKENSQPRFQYLIIEMGPVTDIDTSGIHALEELFRALQKRDIKLVLANPGPVVVDKLHASKFQELIGEGRIFLTVADAVRMCSSKMELEP
ncbi:sulfate transporter 1.3-like [Gossypium australe]|uniref:Sulfate transporter 1.3-like n=1 Tax=Gossypium australe TaxID=47621 RepID=A0A5B6WL07_9ROSI|nr:sulfate transporter 1.3-like [Gossypium australe]